MIACSVDDFPAPFGPMSPTISPGFTSSERPRTASHGAVAHAQLVEDERHCSSATALSPR